MKQQPDSQENSEKIQSMIQNVISHYEFIELFLINFNKLLNDPQAGPILYEYLLEGANIIESDESRSWEVYKQIGTFVCASIVMPIVREGFISQEYAEAMIINNKERWRGPISLLLNLTEARRRNLISEVEFEELMNGNDHISPKEYPGDYYKLIDAAVKNYITEIQFFEIRAMPAESFHKNTLSLAVDMERDRHARFKMRLALNKGELTEGQMDRVLLITDTKIKANTASLIVMPDKDKVLRWIREYFLDNDIEIKTLGVDFSDISKENVSKIIDVYLDFVTAGDTN